MQRKFLLKIIIAIKLSYNLMVTVARKIVFDESWQKL